MDIFGRPRRCLSGSLLRRSWLSLALASVLAAPAAQAASFGHARLASAVGQPLVIVVPVTQLTVADLQSLSARPAPAAAWSQAGLTPPVALGSLSVAITTGPGSKSARVLRVQSTEPFSGTLADLLLDVHTATGSERYQVSVVGPGPAGGVEGTAAAAQGAASSLHGSAVGTTAKTGRFAAVRVIRVHTGDTMFAVARRHSVAGVSVYQLMMALQRANPQAFIHQNINLVRAGASLSVPSVADMLSISDAEARRQFVAQTAAFDRLRGRVAASPVKAGQGSSGSVSQAPAHPEPSGQAASQDRVRLSEARSDRTDARTARGHALKDAESRVDQLQDNVQNLNKALQSQGEAARSVASTGASAIGDSIQKIAGAISQASHEAVAQAADRAAASAADSASGASLASGASTPGGAPGSGGAAPAAGAGVVNAPGALVAGGGAAAGASGMGTSIAGASTGGTSTGGTSTASASVAGTSTAGGSAAGTSAAGGSAAGTATTGGQTQAGSRSGTTANSNATGADPLFNAAGSTPASEAQAHANAEKAEQHATEQTRHRVNWLQDHLLGVMTALLALIVFIIAWLLRRANAARDEADADPHVTEAMVQEKLQGIDLELPAAEQRTSAPGA